MIGPLLFPGKSPELTENRPILDIRVSKKYVGRGSSPFLLQANFQVESGFTVFVGPSGAGKSTLLRCIAGLIDPDEGRITLAGKVLFDSQRKISIAACRRNVAFVFQSLALFPHLTVEENIGYGLRSHSARERQERVQSILESFRIAHLKRNFTREISGGERQRVAVARALVVEPALLLLDEPLSSLDIATKSGIIADLRKWNEEHAVPILYVTHDQNELFALGEQIIVFDPNGEMAEGLGVLGPENMASNAEHGREQDKNRFDATVVDVQPHANLITCRIAHGFDVNAPFRPLPLGAVVEVTLDSGGMLLAGSEPALLSQGSAVRGIVSARTGPADRIGTLKILAPGNLQVEIASPTLVPPQTTVWMLIPPAAVSSLIVKRFRPLQRIVLFIGSSDASLSAMAEMIYNRKVAEHLRIPLQALASSPVRAMSAGLELVTSTGLKERSADALGQTGLEELDQNRPLSPELVMNSTVILCMTQAQCEDLVRKHPYATAKTFRFDSERDLQLPATDKALEELRRRIEQLVEQRITELGM